MDLDTKTVLVIDDSRLVRELLARLCERLGVAVAEASDAPAGLAALRAGGVDLAIIDQHLPDMDGVELVRRIRAHPELRRLPVLLLSASAGPREAQAAASAGANWFVPKGGLPQVAGAVRGLLGLPPGFPYEG